MPLTIVHPALVLPLRHRRGFHWPALALGSMAPDLYYFTGPDGWAYWAHQPTLDGAWRSALAGCILLLGYLLFAKPVAALLPEPWRTPALAAGPLRPVAAVATSLALGIASHVILDNFTHPWGWFVRHLAVLREPWFFLGPIRVDGFKVLQHAGSLIGLAVICWAMLRCGSVPASLAAQSERRRWRIWAVIGVWAAIAGLFNALQSPTPVAIAMRFATASISTAVALSVLAGCLAQITGTGIAGREP